MIKLLSKIFIKNSEDYKKSDVRFAYGILCGVVGIIFNIILFAAKYIAGVMSASIAITADAFNNLSDAGSSFVTLLGFKLSAKKADADHPFGHGRIEYVSGLIVSFVIILMSFELGKSSFQKIMNPVTIESSAVVIIILTASILVKCYMAFYNRSIGKKINSAAMIAVSKDSLSDCISTSVVLISTLIYKFAGINIDAYCGIAVAFFILYTGISAAKDTMSPLLGSAPDKELVKQIEDIVLSYKKILGIHDMVIHDYGPGRLMVSLHAEVPGDLNIFDLHEEIDSAEEDLMKKLHCEATIHMDPICVNDEEIVEARMKAEAIVASFDDCLSIHDFRMVKGEKRNNIIFDLVVPAKYKISHAELNKTVTQKIKTEMPGYFPVIKVEQSYI